MRNNAESSQYLIHSLGRGLRVLEVMAEAGEPLTLSRIAEAMRVQLSTAYRFLYTLEHHEYVERNTADKTYRVAAKVLKLGYSFFGSSTLWQVAHPYLLQARKEFGETFNMAILDGTDILYVDRVKTRKILTVDLEIGSKLPAFCTSMGRVLLASLPPGDARRILEKSDRRRFTGRTVTEVDQLESVLESVRRKGYAINNGEMAVELISVAALVKNRDGDGIAAVNMALNKAACKPKTVKEHLVPTIKALAERISHAMGYYHP